MNSSRTLSLDTVSWTARLAATSIALFVGTLILLPFGFLIRFGSPNPEHLAVGLVISVYLSFLNFGELILRAFVYWALPALTLSHIALRWRLHLFGFVAAGAIAGLLGLMIAGLALYARMTIFDTAMSDPRTVAQWQTFVWGLPYSVVVFSLVGGLGATVARGVMWLGQATNSERDHGIDYLN